MIHRGLIKRSNPLYKKKIQHLKSFTAIEIIVLIKRQLNILQDRIITSIEASKQKYYCRKTNKLINTQKSSKAYWSLMEGFLNNQKNTSYPSVISRKLFYNRLQRKDRTF